MTRPVSPPPLTLVTLGTLGLFAEGQTAPVLGPGKPFALLVYLALTPGRRVSREFLLDLLWADLDPDRARAALRQLLFQLRRLLGDSALPGTEELSLACDLDIDRDRFLAAIEQGELDTAFASYTGAFLPAFGVPGGAAFEHWADLERDRLRALFLRVGEILTRRHLNRSQFREAQRKAVRLRDEAPDAEAAWRLLLETIVAGRDFMGAVLEADRLEQWAAESGVGLEPATRAAIAAARQVSPAPADAGPEGDLVLELTGREREFSAITAAWEAVKSGGPAHLHLSAPAGLGKTRLLRDAVARLRAGGAAVVELRSAPGERDIPWAFAADLAGALAALPGATGIAPASAATLVALHPALSARLSAAPTAVRGDDAGRLRLLALADLVHAVAHEHPFVLVVDDVHWVDPASFRILEGLLGRLAPARTLCLTAARPERGLGSDLTRHLPLAPLTRDQLAGLISALGSLPETEEWASGFVARLHQATSGSPLLVLETLRLATGQEILCLDGGVWRCTDPGRLAQVLQEGEALRARVRALPPAQLRLLALPAIAGTPLPGEWIADASPDAWTALERLGLLTRTPAGWQTAHDEIAAAARDALDAGQRAGLEAALGAQLIARAGPDLNLRFRGMRHLVAAGQDDAARQEFRRYARLARERNDRRPFPELAAEVLAGSPESPEVRALWGDIPLRWRLGLWNPLRQGLAAAGLAALTLGATASLSARADRLHSLQQVIYLDSAGTVTTVRADPDRWSASSEPVAPVRGHTDHAAAMRAFPERWPAESPDQRAVAWNVMSADSTVIDIWIRTPAGTRRLTRENRDDLASGWTPDGAMLVGLTNRWSSPEVGGYDVAVFDTASGQARKVNAGPGHDGAPAVSPDGTRIAFFHEGDGPPQICVSPFDGLDPPVCRQPAGFRPRFLVDWVSATELVIGVDSAGTYPLVVYDLERNSLRPLLGPFVRQVQLSPDRQWVLAGARTTGMEGWRDWIVPVHRPAQARAVNRSESPSMRWWEGRREPTGMIDRIVFTDTTVTILPGIGTRLGIRALSREGAEVPIRAPIRWQSSDTRVATVDRDGVVRAHGSGTVRILASLAGWRSATIELVVDAKPARTVFEEDWSEGWRSRWFTFGEPAPEVTSRDGIRAFWNRGDGTYGSIGVSRRGFPARDGLGIEVRLATPLTRANWQQAVTALAVGIDTARFGGADQGREIPVLSTHRCSATYPDGAGSYGRTRLGFGAGIIARHGMDSASAARLSSGKWWTLRIQIFPDGRCGVALNGIPIAILAEPIPVTGEFRLWLGYESAETRVLHGPLTVWTGVRNDIDWTLTPKETP